MDKYDILLNVRGSHEEEGEENTLELLTEGLLTREDGVYVIEYDESGLSGVEHSKTRLVVDGKRVLLKHIGQVETEFVFNERQFYEAAYDTPVGPVIMSVLPTQVWSELSDEKGHIGLEYVIQVGGQSARGSLNIDYTLRN